MQPGRDLDKLIAEKVFGCSPVLKDNLECGCIPFNPKHERMVQYFSQISHYSTDIKDVWEVVNKFLEKGWNVQVCGDGEQYDSGHWHAEFDPRYASDGDKLIIESAYTAPHAICLAALKAKGIL